MRQAVTVPESLQQQSVVVPEKLARSESREAGFYAATRVGKKKVTATLAPTDHKRLRQLALEEDATTEALLIEAISDLFVKHGKQAIIQKPLSVLPSSEH